MNTYIQYTFVEAWNPTELLKLINEKSKEGWVAVDPILPCQMMTIVHQHRGQQEHHVLLLQKLERKV